MLPQLTVEGGPTVGTYVEFASLDNAIVNVHKSSGLLLAVSSGKSVRDIVNSL